MKSFLLLCLLAVRAIAEPIHRLDSEKLPERLTLKGRAAEAELASTPTPGPRTTMRRSDRAMAVMAKRTPWILREMARLAPATSRS